MDGNVVSEIESMLRISLGEVNILKDRRIFGRLYRVWALHRWYLIFNQLSIPMKFVIYLQLIINSEGICN